MAKTFLEIAEIILRDQKKPLNPDEIFNNAIELGLLSSKGMTPAFSMKARISKDIRENGFASVFMRVGPNRFALREFGLKEHISQPFKKTIPNEIITCIEQTKLGTIKSHFGFSSETTELIEILSNDNLTFVDRKIAENNSNFKQLISYVLLVNKNSDILTYKRGVYTNAHEMLKGSTCLGFGGHVQNIDTHNIFSKGSGGVFDTAEREVFEELKGFKPDNLEIVGYINDDSSPEGVKHLGVVLKGEIPETYKIDQFDKELSVNDLKFMTIKEIWEHFYEFEFWSQLLIKAFYHSINSVNPVVIRPVKFNLSSNIIVFVGEIASGKTTLCEMLTERLGFHSISTRKCVAKLIEEKDFGTEDRKIFQEKAEEFIKKKDGPIRLANEIRTEVDKFSKKIIIDGIRHFETLKELQAIYPDFVIIYVDATRDDSYRNYSNRSKGNANIDQFREIRHHPVENEIKLIKGEASAYIFNGGNNEQLFEAFKLWYNINKK